MEEKDLTKTKICGIVSRVQICKQDHRHDLVDWRELPIDIVVVPRIGSPKSSANELKLRNISR